MGSILAEQKSARWIRILKRLVIVGICFALAIFLSVQLFIYRDISEVSAEKPDNLVYYLGYGSNMSSRYLSNVRNVEIYESHAAIIDDHLVKFNLKGLPHIEPAFANMVVSPGSTSYGVAHLITPKDLKSIVGSEASSYTPTEITVTTDQNKRIKVWTLIGKDNTFNGIPSQRYVAILLEGAVEHGLPSDYIQKLKQLDGAYVPLVSEAAGTLIHLMVISRSY